ncbi:pol polyprotein-like protein, partial [Leptotrombidium deliense]
MYVSTNHRNWCEILPYVIFAYNTSQQESAKFSPFQLVYGREPNLPSDVILKTNDNYINKRKNYIQLMRREALVYIQKAQAKNKQNYDKRHRPTTYKIGDLVLVKCPIRKKGLSEKLLHNYYGPYKIIKQITPVDYKVENQRPSKRKRLTIDTVHISRMKPFITEDDDLLDDVTEMVNDALHNNGSPEGAHHNVDDVQGIGQQLSELDLDCREEMIGESPRNSPSSVGALAGSEIVNNHNDSFPSTCSYLVKAFDPDNPGSIIEHCRSSEESNEDSDYDYFTEYDTCIDATGKQLDEP